MSADAREWMSQTVVRHGKQTTINRLEHGYEIVMSDAAGEYKRWTFALLSACWRCAQANGWPVNLSEGATSPWM